MGTRTECVRVGAGFEEARAGIDEEVEVGDVFDSGMRRRSGASGVVALFMALWASAGAREARAEGPDARLIASEALSAERLGFRDGEATLGMELRDKAGRIVSRKLIARTASGANGGRKMRMTFLEPSDQKGIELLVVEARGQETLQYLWLPRASELRRIAGGERGGRFQGSDFSFADFEGKSLDAAVVEMVGSEKVGGLETWKIAVSPKPGAVGPGGWSRVVAWVAKDGHVPVKVEFDKGGTVERRLEVKKLQAVEGRLTPTRLVMSDLVAGTRTTLDILDIQPTKRFPDATFAPESLGR